MKHFQLATLFALTLPLFAAEPPKEVQWSELCQASGQRPLQVTTTNGETSEGYCMFVSVNEVTLQTRHHKIVKIARDAFSRAHVRPRHPMQALGQDMHKHLKTGIDDLLSPRAPLGLVFVPSVLAWGAIAAPFCALGELRDVVEGGQELKVN